MKLFFDLGDGTSIPKKKAVLILNAETATLKGTTRQFLKKLGAEGNAVVPKRTLNQVNSFVLCNAYGKDSLYSSSHTAGFLAAEFCEK